MKKPCVFLNDAVFYYVPDNGCLFFSKGESHPVYLFERNDLSWLSSIGEIVDFLAPDDVGGFDLVKAIKVSGDVMDSVLLFCETIEAEGIDIYR